MNKQLLERFKRGEVILYTPTFEDMKLFLMWCEKQNFVWCTGECCLDGINRTFSDINDNCGFFIDKNKCLDLTHSELNRFILTAKDLEPDKQEFTKDDLKVGMIVECSNESKFIVANKTLYRIDIRESHNLITWNEDLTGKANDDYNIIKIYTTNNLIQVLEGNYNSLQLVWERDAVDWSNVEVDTKILVKDFNGQWLKRYFAGYENGKIYTWAEGSTSFSTEKPYLRSYYSDAKLYKEDK